jgi:3-oxoacyl-[acyl-carrier protein] reductase
MAAPIPPYPQGRSLLAGKTVVVTAAAGTGIGFSAAKRAVEEGATVLMSDFTNAVWAKRPTGSPPNAASAPQPFVCDVTSQDQVDAPSRCRAGRAGPCRCADQQCGAWRRG